jgi:S1-C subfamily serine protease
MMRENESDNGDGRPGPYDYIGPWASHGTGEPDQASAADGDPESDRQDTIAFGRPADEAGQGAYAQHGYSDPWYSSDRDEPGYGSYAGPGGYRSGGSGSGGSGFGSGGGWDPPPPPPRRARRRGHLLVYLAVAVLAAGVGAGLTVAFYGQGSSPAASASSGSSGDIPSPHDDQTGPGSGLNEAAVERKVRPGLVDITSTLKYASETAEGTGMILSPSGLVLTNNHVIDGATSVSVMLVDCTRCQPYTAQVVGYDSVDDVALLKLTGAAGLATVSFGDSSQVQVGTPVLALGDAEGRGGVTPALGDISGVNRSIQASDEGSGTVEDLNHMLATSAQIQQGDSGGALANNAGQVIGMVTAANTASGTQPGNTTGFAIPIDSALAIAQKIADNQASATIHIGLPGFLGVEVAQTNASSPRQQAREEQQSGDNQGPPGPGCVAVGQEPGVPRRIAPASTGALILGVLCGTAAPSRGLVPGDVIISVNGQGVTNPNALTAVTAQYRPGQVVSVSWLDTRGRHHTAKIMLGDGPAR